MGANAGTAVPTYASGDVLTAANLNLTNSGAPVFADTSARDGAFGSGKKTLAEGQLCYLEDANVVQYYDGSSWAIVGPASAGAFTYITGASFTTVAAVNVNNCFTSTYRNYALVYDLSGSTTLTVTMRFRVGGVDDSASSYIGGGTVIRLSAGQSDILDNGASAFTVGLTSAGDAARRVRAHYTIYGPQLSQRSGISGTGTSAGSSSSEFGGLLYGGEFANTTVFDGFSLIASTGTITGTYRVYGLADS